MTTAQTIASCGDTRPAAIGRRRFVGCSHVALAVADVVDQVSGPGHGAERDRNQKRPQDQVVPGSGSSGSQSWFTEKISAMNTMAFFVHWRGRMALRT